MSTLCIRTATAALFHSFRNHWKNNTQALYREHHTRPTKMSLSKMASRRWILDPCKGYFQGEVLSEDGDIATIRLPSGKTMKAGSKLVFLQNNEAFDKVDEVSQLPNQSLPTVVHLLQCRYSSDQIYVSTLSYLKLYNLITGRLFGNVPFSSAVQYLPFPVCRV